LLRALLIIGGYILLWTAMPFPVSTAIFAADNHHGQSFAFNEGTVSKAVITAGPFDLHRKYRSMEGPYISFDFKVGDIVASKQTNLPEGMVTFVEGNNSAPSMMGGSASSTALTKNVEGLVDTSSQPRTLLWLKGIKLEVLDENDRLLPTAEFICHWNLDVKPNFRNTVFSQAQRCETVRLATITQGQTEITFPEGYGVPVASDEPWNAVFQAANRTRDEHIRVKHRCTFYFIKDSDLVYPITALGWYAPWIYVVIDKNSPEVAVVEKANCPSCFGLTAAINAPNNTSNGTFTDSKGRRLSGHWVIPPGTHSYRATINDEMEPGFASKPRLVHAIWSHVHPLCTDLSLYKCEGNSREKMFSNGAKTETAHGLEIKHIDYWSSKKGILLPDKVNYELEVTYKNTTNVPQDSMATAGVFFEDPTFVRPDWVLHAKEGYACSMVGVCHGNSQSTTNNSVSTAGGAAAGIAAGGIATSATAANTAITISAIDTPPEISKLPLFDRRRDGPLLTEAKNVVLQTNAGPITLRIDPSLAPITATQIYRLLCSGAFIGTRICRYDANYVLQFAMADDKAPMQPPLTDQSRGLLRRIPLEISNQKDKEINHHKYVLSMARYSDSQDNAVSSFSIVLQDSPHLDYQYAIFGKIAEDTATLETLAKIENNWDPHKYWITDTSLSHNAAIAQQK